ncbi:centromere protein X isoform X2 [Rhinolophus ferrumequinum]|uniref:centromere protein X isoform X2 n=1 Tax=Rhinolophus ferrumequinum TaxID=59479 RepID=UPI00140FC1B7|nr:centromere protein X isoform X2 [Rhinolophus ferrumequinum]
MRARNGHALRASSRWSQGSALTAHWMGGIGVGLRRARSGVIGWRIGGGAGKARSGLIGGGPGLRRARDAARVMEATSSGFRKELVSKLLHLHFKDDKTKVGGDALLLMAELLKIFVSEAAIRSVRQAQAEDLARVDVEQLEKLLDF